MFESEFDPDKVAIKSWVEIYGLNVEENFIFVSGLLPTSDENSQDVIQAIKKNGEDLYLVYLSLVTWH